MPMINKLCKACINTCKQSDSTKIVSCPKFQKIPSDKEFQDMVDELDNTEIKAKKLQKRVKELIDKAVSRDLSPPAESEEKD